MFYVFSHSRIKEIQNQEKKERKKEMSPSTPNINNNNCPPPLKINKDSHMIKKSSSSSNSSPPSSSSSSSASSLTVVGPAKLPPQGPQRHPVIIYTHSPKIIHTNPKDFMQLVQKLTGLSRPEDDHPPRVKQEKSNSSQDEESKNVRSIGNGNDDNESSSVITEENCGGSIVDGQVNSCFAPPIFDPPNPYMTNIPVFTPNSADFLCANQPFFNYTDSLFFNPPSVRSSISSSSSTLEGINELREY